MLTRLKSFFVALGFVAGFVVCLSFDLHGAFAVACALGFLAFASAAIDRRTKILQLIKRIIGAVIIAVSILSFKGNPHQNLVFLITLAVCGILLLLDPLVLWITRPTK